MPLKNHNQENFKNFNINKSPYNSNNSQSIFPLNRSNDIIISYHKSCMITFLNIIISPPFPFQSILITSMDKFKPCVALLNWEKHASNKVITPYQKNKTKAKIYFYQSKKKRWYLKITWNYISHAQLSLLTCTCS